MADRSTCKLTIKGLIDKTTWDEIEEMIDVLLAPDECHEDGAYTIFGVNYGDIPHQLDDKLREVGLSYVWTNDGGTGFSPEIYVYDASAKEFEQYAGFDMRLIVMSVEEAEDPEFRTNARRWQDFINSKEGLTIV
tara:strand:+ start:5503 stop:5907 length:405 start_codon:yes stop_codon:yes gene_type:complete